MRGVEVLLAASGLLLLPVIATSLYRVNPRSMSLLGTTSTAIAAAIVLFTLSVCAGAAIQDLALTSHNRNGAMPLKHLIPGVPGTGWLSLTAVGIAIIAAIGSINSTTKKRRQMSRHLSLGDRCIIGDIPVVTLATDEFLAAAVPGEEHCVIISRGTRSALSDSELRAVLAHEQAHLNLGHHRHMLLARTLERSLWFVPGMHPALRNLKISLELAADARASEQVGVNALNNALTNAGQYGHVGHQRLDNTAHESVSGIGLFAAWVVFAAFTGTAVGLMLSWLGTGL